MFDPTPREAFPDQPAPTSTVWRYMDLPRFISLLEDEALYFARADQMVDRWEGSYSSVNLELRPRLYGEAWTNVAPHITQLRELSRQLIHMSCWHEAAEESAAMWDLYQREGRGVAVRSTWGDLTASLGSDRAVVGGRISYVDYDETYIPEGNLYAPFMHKRRSFSHEKEVRLLMLTGDQEGKTMMIPEEPALPVPVDIKRLINAIYVAPEAPRWLYDLIGKVVRRYGHQIEIRQSDLALDPID